MKSEISNGMNASAYAALRGRSRSWLTRQLKLGMPAVRSGRQGAEIVIDPAAAIDWEIARAEVDQKPSQRDRLASVQADKIAMANAKARQKVMLRDQLEPVLAAMLSDLEARLEATAAELPALLATLTDPAEIRSRLLAAHRSVRAGAAEHLRKLAHAGPDPQPRKGRSRR